MKAPRKTLFLILIILALFLHPVLAINDFGEDEDYLGQIVDYYENDNNIAVMIDTINNQTLDCMELNITGFNFLDFTEVDGSNDITVIAEKIDWDTMRRDAEAWVYYDYGVDYFGDFDYNFTFSLSDVEAGDSSGQNFLAFISLTNSIGSVADTIGGDALYCVAIQNAAVDDQFNFRLLQYTGGVIDFSDIGVARGIGTFYCTFTRVGTTITLKIYDNIDREPGDLLETLNDGGGGSNTKYRYFNAVQSWDSATDPNDHSSGYVEYDWPWFVSTGVYYTVNVLDGDPALEILYNATIPIGANMTMEFSTDNVTWVDHNNEAGSDTLIAGYEALDLRDIYNGTTYRRVNMTSDGSDTPRMWQERFVTVTEVVEAEEGDTIIMGGSGVFWIILIIIVPIVAYMVNKK